jgi:ABC-type sugar transport system ATPase subunit
VASARRDETSPDQVVRWMVGRTLGSVRYQSHPVADTPLLEVQDISLPSPPGSVGRPSLAGISFRLRVGEVLGVAGLLGAGRTELLEALFGASGATPSGTIKVGDQVVRFRGPADAMAAGVALVTEDRKGLGLFDRMTVAENITINSLAELTLAWLVDPRSERRAVADSVANLGIKTAGGGAAITSLSGGNQQKCVLARWLRTRPRVLLLDEPTRGIDVGAKAEIYALMRRLAEGGMGILMTSSELPELLAVCDRILVLCEGRLTAEFPHAEATEEAIMTAATKFLDRGKQAG